jgi:hypothetical protein
MADRRKLPSPTKGATIHIVNDGYEPMKITQPSSETIGPKYELVCGDCNGEGWTDVGTTFHEKRRNCDTCRGIGVRGIRVDFVFPPIPDRTSDWQATFEGDKEGPAGWGISEQAAVDDLKDNHGFD